MSLSIYDRSFFEDLGATNAAYRGGCHAVAEEVHRLFRPERVVDWGCGAGLHAERLVALGVEVTAIDGVLAPDDLRAPDVEVRVHDIRLPAPPDLVPTDVDLVLCLDVLEHVEPESEAAALANLTAHGRTLVLSCAPPGQGGTGHVNERPRRHWIARLRDLGFTYDRRASGRLADAVRARPEVPHSWMSHHLAVYRRGAVAREGRPLQKWLVRFGRLSKSSAQKAIREGRVTLDGAVVTRFAEPVREGSRVELDGRRIEESAAFVYLLLHKPRKHLSVLEPRDRADGLGRYLPEDSPRLFLVGRLDYGSEGAILLTNDGELARRILHPSTGLPRTYRVKVRDRLAPDSPAIASLARPIRLRGRVVRAREVAFEAHRTRATWIRIVIAEGVHHEIRALCRRAGLQIVKLRREAIGPVELGDLKPRCTRPLTPPELHSLRKVTLLPHN